MWTRSYKLSVIDNSRKYFTCFLSFLPFLSPSLLPPSLSLSSFSLLPPSLLSLSPLSPYLPTSLLSLPLSLPLFSLPLPLFSLSLSLPLSPSLLPPSLSLSSFSLLPPSLLSLSLSPLSPYLSSLPPLPASLPPSLLSLPPSLLSLSLPLSPSLPPSLSLPLSLPTSLLSPLSLSCAHNTDQLVFTPVSYARNDCLQQFIHKVITKSWYNLWELTKLSCYLYSHCSQFTGLIGQYINYSDGNSKFDHLFLNLSIREGQTHIILQCNLPSPRASSSQRSCVWPAARSQWPLTRLCTCRYPSHHQGAAQLRCVIR